MELKKCENIGGVFFVAVISVFYHLSTVVADTCIPSVNFKNCKAESGSENPLWNLPFDRDHMFSVHVENACRKSSVTITWELYAHATHDHVQDLKKYKNRLTVEITARSLPLAAYIFEVTVREQALGKPAGYGKAECWFKIGKSLHPARGYKLFRADNSAKMRGPRCVKNCVGANGPGLSVLGLKVYLHTDVSSLITDRKRREGVANVTTFKYNIVYKEVTKHIAIKENKSACHMLACQVLTYDKHLSDRLSTDTLKYLVIDSYSGDSTELSFRHYLFRPSMKTGIRVHAEYNKHDCTLTSVVFSKPCQWKVIKFIAGTDMVRARVTYELEGKVNISITVATLKEQTRFAAPGLLENAGHVAYWGLSFGKNKPLPLEFYFTYNEGHEQHNFNTQKVKHSPTTWQFEPLYKGNNLKERIEYARKVYFDGITIKTDKKDTGLPLPSIRNHFMKKLYESALNLISNYIHSTFIVLCCTEGSTLEQSNLRLYLDFLGLIFDDLSELLETVQYVWNPLDDRRDINTQYEDLPIRLSAGLVRLNLPKHVIPSPEFIAKRSRLANLIAKTLHIALSFAEYPLAHTHVETSYYTLRYCIHHNMGYVYAKAKKELVFTTTIPSIEFHKVIPEDYPDYESEPGAVDVTTRNLSIYSMVHLIEASHHFIDAMLRTVTIMETKKDIKLEFFTDKLVVLDSADFLMGTGRVTIENVTIDFSQPTGTWQPNDFAKFAVILLKRKIFFYLGLDNEVPFDFVMLRALIQKDRVGKHEKVPGFLNPVQVFYGFPTNDSLKYRTHTMSLPDRWKWWTAEELNDAMFLIKLGVTNNSRVALTVKDVSGFPDDIENPTILISLLETGYPLYPDHFTEGNTKRVFRFTKEAPVHFYTHSMVDCFMFLGVIPLRPGPAVKRNTSTKAMQMQGYGLADDDVPVGGTVDIKFTLGVALYQCLQLEKDKIFRSGDCRVSQKVTRIDGVQCECDKVFVMSPIVNNIEQHPLNTTRVQFDLDITVSWELFLIPLLVFFLFCLLLALAGRRRTPAIHFCFTGDNNKADRYGYMLAVKTSDLSGSGTTSNVVVKMYGRKASSEPYVLNYPDPDLRLLQTATEDYFVVATAKYLGELRYIEIWTDVIGFKPSWHCDYICIYDLRRRKRWFFDVQTVFALRDNFFCYQKVFPSKKQEGKRHTRNIFRHFGVNFGPLHTFNIFDPSHDWQLSYLYRLTLILSHIYVCFALTVLIVSFPRMRYMDSLGWAPILNFGDFVYYSVIIAICASLPNFLLMVFYRSSASGGTIKDKFGAFPRGTTVVCWMCLIALTTASMCYILAFGWWVATITVTSVLLIFATALLLDILILENLYLTFYRIYRVHVMKKISQTFGKINFINVVLEAENQRRFLYRRISLWGLRPFLKHLYMPLTDALLRERRQMDQLRQNLRRIIRNIVLVGGLGIIFIILAAIKFSTSEAYMSEHMVDMIVRAKFADSNISVDRVFAIEDFYTYLNKTVVPTTMANRWYGEYHTNDRGLMQDFQTKIVNVVRVRKLAVEPSKCPDRDLAKVFDITTCIAPWTFSNSDKKGEGEFISQISYQSYDSSYQFHPYIESKYEGGGFMVGLGRSLFNGQYIIKRMWNNEWLTNTTRALFVEFWTYNANTGLFTDVRILFERGPSKLTIGSYRITSTNADIDDPHVEWVCVALIVLAILFVLALTIVIIGQILRRGITFFCRLWSLFDLAIVISCMFFFVYTLYQNNSFNRLMNEAVDQPRNVFVAPFIAMDDIESIRFLSGFIIFFCILRMLEVFRFLDFFRDVHYALVKSFPPILCCVIIALIGFFGMSVIGFVRFSPESIYFSTIHQSFATQWLIISRLYADPVDYLKNESGFARLYLIILIVMGIVLKLFLIVIIVIIFREWKRRTSGLRWSYTLMTYAREFFNYYYEYTVRNIIPIKKKTNLRGGGDLWYKEPISPKALQHRYEDVYTIGIDKMNLMRCVLLAVLRNEIVRRGRRPGAKDFILMEEIARAVYKVHHPRAEQTGGLHDENTLYSYPVRVPNKRARLISDGRVIEMEAVARECVTTQRAEQMKSIMHDRQVMVPDLQSLGRIETIRNCLVLLGVVFDNIAVTTSPMYGERSRQALASVRSLRALHGDNGSSSSESSTEETEEEYEKRDEWK